jgi:hypothetical protein
MKGAGTAVMRCMKKLSMSRYESRDESYVGVYGHCSENTAFIG